MRRLITDVLIPAAALTAASGAVIALGIGLTYVGYTYIEPRIMTSPFPLAQ
jgi:hypothetical protein